MFPNRLLHIQSFYHSFVNFETRNKLLDNRLRAVLEEEGVEATTPLKYQIICTIYNIYILQEIPELYFDDSREGGNKSRHYHRRSEKLRIQSEQYNIYYYFRGIL